MKCKVERRHSFLLKCEKYTFNLWAEPRSRPHQIWPRNWQRLFLGLDASGFHSSCCCTDFTQTLQKKFIGKILNFSRPVWRFMKNGCVYFASPWWSYSWDFCQKAMLQCGRNNWRSKSCGRSRWLLSYLESLSSFQHYLEFVKMRNSRANGTFRHFKPASILGCSRCDSCGGSGGVRPQ